MEPHIFRFAKKKKTCSSYLYSNLLLHLLYNKQIALSTIKSGDDTHANDTDRTEEDRQGS